MTGVWTFTPRHLLPRTNANPVHNPNGISIGSAVSLQLTMLSPYTSQWGMSPHILPSPGGSGPQTNTWFLGPIESWVHNPNRISITLTFFCRIHAGVPTDYATSLAIGHILCFAHQYGLIIQKLVYKLNNSTQWRLVNNSQNYKILLCKLNKRSK